jgi:uncharacterized protein YijF (DUF1287 family)
MSALFKTLTLLALVALGDVHALGFSEGVIAKAREQTLTQVTYDGSYRIIPYPMGDVPHHIGVCTDVIIPAYRGMGIDLQALVHRDMKANFSQYPKLWGPGLSRWST